MEYNNKKKSVIVALVILLVASVSFTMAYFTAQLSGDNATNVRVSSNAQTSLIFNKGDDIVIDAGVDNFFEGSGNAVSITNPSVSLTSSEIITENYNIYFEIISNNFIYTTDSKKVELLLTVLDENNAPIEVIEGLEYVTVGDVSGFDITTKQGLFEVMSNNEITTDKTTTTEEWTFTVTFINLDTDQFFNSGKELEAEIVLQKGIKGITPIVEAITLSNDGENTLAINLEDNGTIIQGYKLIEESEICMIDGITLDTIKVTSSSVNKLCIYNNADDLVEEILNLVEITLDYGKRNDIETKSLIVNVDNSSYTFETPLVDYYSFEGWFDGTKKISDISDVESDVTLLAKYESTVFKDGQLNYEILVNESDNVDNDTEAIEFIDSKADVDFDVISIIDEGLQVTFDDYGTSYYYRGAVEDNWVSFGGLYWRIIRIDGNGGIKLIYSGNEETGPTIIGSDTQITQSSINSNDIYLNDGVLLSNSSEGVGYVYGDNELHGLSSDSLAKSTIDTWYDSNLLEYNDYISNTTFCVDRIAYSDTGGSTEIFDVTENDHYFATYIGLHSNKKPSLMCTNENDKLDVKVGLISANEVSFAGGERGAENSSFYLYTGVHYWTISPFYFSDGYAALLAVRDNGSLTSSSNVNNLGLRPTITLKSDTKLLDGNGTINDPYFVV